MGKLRKSHVLAQEGKFWRIGTIILIVDFGLI